MTCRAAFAAFLILFATQSFGAEPATAPATKISDDARKVIKEVSAAYAQIQSADLSGTITGRFDVNGEKKVFDDKFKAEFARGQGFRHEMADDLIAVGNTKTVYVYHVRQRAFSQADAGAALPDEADDALRAQNLSLALLLSGDVGAELSKAGSAIERGADESIDGAKCETLTIANDIPLVLCFDAQSHLLRRMSADFKKDLEQHGAVNVAQAAIVVDYTEIKPGATVDNSIFAWTPPEGARDLASAGGGDQGGAASELAGKPAPELALKGLDGQPFKLSEHKGSVVVLDFWATWCGPCRAALPHLDEIYQQKRGDGLRVFAVDQGETDATVKAFVNDSKLGIPVILDPEGAGGAKYKVEGIPQTVVIGKNGVVKKVFVGFDEDGVKAAIEQAMTEK
jgi:thiol-disulfide isomerase/thioredoxin/outer membrane lipoprotein-sorting protein